MTAQAINFALHLIKLMTILLSYMSKVTKAQRAIKVSLLLVDQGRKALKDFKVFKAQLDPLAYKVMLAQKAKKALLVNRAVKEHKVYRVPLVLAHKVNKGFKVIKAKLVRKAFKVLLVRRAIKAKLAHKGFKAQKELVLKALKVYKGIKAKLAHKEFRALLVCRVTKVLLAHRAIRELLGHKAIKVLLGHKAFRALLGHRAIKVLLVLKAIKVLLVLKVNKDLKAIKVLLGHKAIKVLLAHRVTKVLLVLKVNKDLKAINTVFEIKNRNDTLDIIKLDASGPISLVTDGDGNIGGPYTWQFSTSGSVTFPDSSIQTTAFTANPTVNLLNVKQVIETTNALSSATGTVTHNCALGHIFVHSSVSANFTPNFTNVTIPVNSAAAFTLVINQGATAYVANAVQIGGVAQTVNWLGSTTAPAGNANKKDVISFSVVNNNGTWITLGQLTSFG
jgi:hypothetical protein